MSVLFFQVDLIYHALYPLICEFPNNKCIYYTAMIELLKKTGFSSSIGFS